MPDTAGAKVVVEVVVVVSFGLVSAGSVDSTGTVLVVVVLVVVVPVVVCANVEKKRVQAFGLMGITFFSHPLVALSMKQNTLSND